jgi:hypothetical protein
MSKDSETLTEHVMALRNSGVMESLDLTGHAGTPGRGVFLPLCLKVQDDRIAAAKCHFHAIDRRVESSITTLGNEIVCNLQLPQSSDKCQQSLS